MHWAKRSFIPSLRHRFLYLPIAKVACSSIKKWIVALTLGADALGNAEIHEFARQRLELGSYPAPEADEILNDRSLLRFAFVRNPWDRLVSGFLQKFISHVDNPARRFLTAMERRRAWNQWLHLLTAGWLGESTGASDQDIDQRLTFRHFVAELRKLHAPSFDSHWRPQHLFLAGEKVDFLGRFERMADDFAELRRRLQLGGTLPQFNCTPRGAATTACLADWPLERLRALPHFPDYQQFYDGDLASIVADIYADDIRQFGYEFRSSTTRSRAA